MQQDRFFFRKSASLVDNVTQPYWSKASKVKNLLILFFSLYLKVCLCVLSKVILGNVG